MGSVLILYPNNWIWGPFYSDYFKLCYLGVRSVRVFGDDWNNYCYILLDCISLDIALFT